MHPVVPKEEGLQPGRSDNGKLSLLQGPDDQSATQGTREIRPRDPQTAASNEQVAVAATRH